MLKFISNLFGGSKSEKDVQQLMPIIEKVALFFQEYQSLSNDALRAKTQEFKQRIKEHLTEIDALVESKKAAAEALPVTNIHERDAIYQEIDILKKERNKKIEEVLAVIQPEAFAAVKETASRLRRPGRRSSRSSRQVTSTGNSRRMGRYW